MDRRMTRLDRLHAVVGLLLACPNEHPTRWSSLHDLRQLCHAGAAAVADGGAEGSNVVPMSNADGQWQDGAALTRLPT